MEHSVKIIKKGKAVELKAKEGAPLLKFLRENGISVRADCGGHGTCGKCRLRINGLPDIQSAKEKKLLGEKAIQKGYRLACYQKIHTPLEIYFDDSGERAKILTESKKKQVKIDPLITKAFLKLPQPGMEDQRPDIQRVLDHADRHRPVLSTEFLRTLPGELRSAGFRATIGLLDKKVIFVESGDTTQKNYGVAVDIGTTTIAAYLYDLNSGRELGVHASLNPQREYGADVLSRIRYTMESATALEQMHTSILNGINQMIETFCSRNEIQEKDIHTVVFAGNTTMLHFLMKLPAEAIAAAPFIPVTTQLHKIRAKELGLRIHPLGYAVILPGVSAYVGADTVAAVLSSGMSERKKISLLLDIGTNGEMVLGNSQWMVACSTAAGPAFEGANIRNGVGGIAGAIDKVCFTPRFSYTTVEDEGPIGICGSGIMDTVAGMLAEGILLPSGRIAGDGEQVSSVWRERMTELDGLRAFVIEKEIAITQKDIREIQNAKAAIAAGIGILVREAGIRLKDIDHVYLAGGFGSYMNVDSALRIGLIPGELQGRMESIGNAAGAGAAAGLLNKRMLEKMEKIRDKIRYIELSSRKDFSEEYIENMTFGLTSENSQITIE